MFNVSSFLSREPSTSALESTTDLSQLDVLMSQLDAGISKSTRIEEERRDLAKAQREANAAAAMETEKLETEIQTIAHETGAPTSELHLVQPVRVREQTLDFIAEQRRAAEALLLEACILEERMRVQSEWSHFAAMDAAQSLAARIAEQARLEVSAAA